MNANERKYFLLFSVPTGKTLTLLINEVLNKITAWNLFTVAGDKLDYSYTHNAFICVHLRSFAFSFSYSFNKAQPCNH